MTVTFSFVHGVFEPIEQWSARTLLHYERPVEPDQAEFATFRSDENSDYLKASEQWPGLTQSNFLEKSQSVTLRWSEVLANAYTYPENILSSYPVWPRIIDNLPKASSSEDGVVPATFPIRIPQSVMVLLILAGSFLTVGMSDRLGSSTAVSVVSVLGIAYVFSAYELFLQANIWMDLVPFPLTLLLACGASVISKTTIQKRSKSLNIFDTSTSSLIPPFHQKFGTHFATQQRRMVTVLFADIRGFSRMAEDLPPEDVRDILETYQFEVTGAVVHHGGTIDKYMGDGVMALFNVPRSHPDHALRAVHAAVECQRRLRRLESQFQQQYGRTLACGIGIHTGEALVGTMGSTRRFEYTAIGDTVNLAANLEELSKVYRVPIVISEATHHAIGSGYHSRHLDEVRVKGRERFVRIHAVVEHDDRQVERRPVKGQAFVQQHGAWSWGEIGDLSSRGMLLKHLEQPLGEGSILDLHLDTSNHGLPHSLRAKVIWAQSHRAGLEFVESHYTVPQHIGTKISQSDHVPMASSPV